MQTITQQLLFVGGGNMASAIIDGASQSSTLDPDRVAVIDPSAERHQFFEHAFADASGAIRWLAERDASPPVIVLAVKPQMLAAAAPPLVARLERFDEQPLVISILAGTRIEQIERVFENKARVVRVMPNTPAQIGLGMSAIAPSEQASGADIDLTRRLFDSVGKSVLIGEDLMDAFTGIAGSGPAYVFYLAEAMMHAAEELGFDRQQAQTIVRQTVQGSASLLAQSPEMPRALRDRVTSRNGTTFAATTTLDESGVMDAIVRAIHAARHRGIELSREQ